MRKYSKPVKVQLFGENGQRCVEVQTRGGFPTRHIKVPYEPVPSLFSPVTPEMIAAEKKAVAARRKSDKSNCQVKPTKRA